MMDALSTNAASSAPPSAGANSPQTKNGPTDPGSGLRLKDVMANNNSTTVRMEHRTQSGGDDEPMSDPELSRDDEESMDTISRIPPGDLDQETLEQWRKQEREEREEIEKELRAQNLSAAQQQHKPEAVNVNNNANSRNKESTPLLPFGLDLVGQVGKEPLPLGLAGLEAFRREYLTSTTASSTSASSLLPPSFHPLLPPHVSAATMASIAESSFGSGKRQRPPSSSSGSATPPATSHRSPQQQQPQQQQQQRSPSSSEYTSQQNWSFEEQFKQLYELSDDAKRKDFLDDLFAFMQKRGTPINRLPIMAKQVLDLYELYNLVTARGGLVEVINKKQWQEIIKGLNLPSSITSAAFTLRTQYTKYLYPYECHMKNLSNPNELQAAIDGNRREGRRSGYDSYPHPHPLFPHCPPPPHGPQHPAHPHPGLPPRCGPPTVPLPPSSLPLSPLTPHGLRPGPFNGNAAVAAAAAAAAAGFPGLTSSPGGGGGKQSPPGGSGPGGLNPSNPLSALEMTRLALFKMYNNAPFRDLPRDSPMDMGRAMAEQQVRALQAVREAEQQQQQKQQSDRERDESQRAKSAKDIQEESGLLNEVDDDLVATPPPMKRERRESASGGGGGGAIKTNGSSPMAGANIRISSRGDSSDSSLVVSLELNSIVYQGVLFAQQPSKSANNAKENNKNRMVANNEK